MRTGHTVLCRSRLRRRAKRIAARSISPVTPAQSFFSSAGAGGPPIHRRGSPAATLPLSSSMRGCKPRKPRNNKEASFGSRISPCTWPNPAVPALEQVTRKRSGSTQTNESVSPMSVLPGMACRVGCGGQVGRVDGAEERGGAYQVNAAAPPSRRPPTPPRPPCRSPRDTR